MMINIQGWTDKEGNSITWEPEKLYTSPDGEIWGSLPFTKEQKKYSKAHARMMRCIDRVIEHLTRTNRSILEELELINTGKSTLPRYAKDYLLDVSNDTKEEN